MAKEGNEDKEIQLKESEINALREQIRVEERQKLQQRVTALETEATRAGALTTEVNELKALNAQLAGKLAETEKVLTTLQAAVKTDASGSTVDVQRLVAEITQQVSQSQGRQLHETVQELQRKVLDLEGERQNLKMQAYKSRRISEEQAAGRQLIVELVGGNTEAEIEKAILTAQEVYARHIASARATVVPAGTQPAPKPAEAPGNGPAPVLHSQPGGPIAAPAPSTDDESVTGLVARMRRRSGESARLYAENRTALREAAEAEFHRENGANAVVR